MIIDPTKQTIEQKHRPGPLATPVAQLIPTHTGAVMLTFGGETMLLKIAAQLLPFCCAGGMISTEETDRKPCCDTALQWALALIESHDCLLEKLRKKAGSFPQG